MLCTFLTNLGIVPYDLSKPTETITSDSYPTQLVRMSQPSNHGHLQHRERPDKVILQHHKCLTLGCKSSQEIIGNVVWEVVLHVPYASYDCFLDYHFLQSPGRDLADQHFQSYEKLKNWIDLSIISKDEQFLRRRIRTTTQRWENVVLSNGEYFGQYI